MSVKGGRSHWDAVYERKAPHEVSWYQASLERSLDLIAKMELPHSADIIDVGGGASTLVDDLVRQGFRNVTVLDLSGRAIAATRRRLGKRANDVTWIEGDITVMELPEAGYDVWHDRAAFHFLTDPAARRRYVDLAQRALRPGGHLLIATFGVDGPERCSGLEVVRYDAAALAAQLGAPFSLVRHVGETHKTPRDSEQEFVYCHFCRAERLET